MFVCAGNTESFAWAKSVGVGLVQSALNLSRLCLLEKPEVLVFVGTAGSYDPKTPFLSLFASHQATQIEESFTLEHSYTPLNNGVQAQEMPTLNLPKALVNSSNYIHTDRGFSHAMCHAGILLENMEFFSVLCVAKAYQIPSFGIFCVTNHTNEHAHKDFMANHNTAKERLEAISKQLKDFYDE
ncbi:purine nucleoside phosphorylase (punB) [Helicobacter heilmannii]|uniref:Purine nucleoside phosphorylase (PunB) n=1 Tax=Helicobacter heilmannii TaxID=35817 RepID=A0A0K2XK59_HELHE|nr:purine nucleoside phosphorylase (punB) [Helicobacter heilmannii]CCM11820.1 purine nucleoside phosphorylase (punB) [Helicobacter heilmannii ASB1.4]CRF46417.1 purine nucleoside phosphorylase (punB) [Helicobacter heilmannii]CRF48131.1 purine nucleoside phosphorylase (punB) [Helicobacter heilmannii]CRF48835.1 purine nucleoside phosphorylase (punB) [Helicobacter heilmannii]CRF51139.1 purine nucleoside phosphorylase (punB) [Helicobacter heilmannii]